ncbi:hypothetical protein EG329_011675 [Mollisiaceae sp. DMI_Dod_QoI]|nr:hypothetical protein EG329_011675 [Helotiales sp. DMI_Dod_QoI]
MAQPPHEGRSMPDRIVYDGLQYNKSLIDPNEVRRNFDYVKVVALEMDSDEDEDDITEAGPYFAIFQDVVYRKSVIPPEEIEDDVLRTVYASILAPVISPIPASQVATQSFYNQDGDSRQTKVPIPPQSAQYKHLPANRDFPIVPIRVMPPRARVVYIDRLPMLFDVPVHQRATIQVILPKNKNEPHKLRPNGRNTRSRWTGEHTRYLDELIWLGMLMLNRPLMIKDFQAVTEALHRRFRGTPDYPIRGINTIHSYVTRRLGYHDFVNRVLPRP